MQSPWFWDASTQARRVATRDGASRARRVRRPADAASADNDVVTRPGFVSAEIASSVPFWSIRLCSSMDCSACSSAPSGPSSAKPGPSKVMVSLGKAKAVVNTDGTRKTRIPASLTASRPSLKRYGSMSIATARLSWAYGWNMRGTRGSTKLPACPRISPGSRFSDSCHIAAHRRLTHIEPK